MELWATFTPQSRPQDINRIRFEIADYAGSHNLKHIPWEPQDLKGKIKIVDFAYERIAGSKKKGSGKFLRSTIYIDIATVTTPELKDALKRYMLTVYQAQDATLAIEVFL